MSRKFWSFNTVDGFNCSTYRLTSEPFRSNTWVSKSGLRSNAHPSIRRTLNSFFSLMYLVLIVKTPNVFASKVFFFIYRWFVNLSRNSHVKSLSSLLDIVLTMYFLSCEKKKKEPELPPSSPLNAAPWLYRGDRDSYSDFKMSSVRITFLKRSYLW